MHVIRVGMGVTNILSTQSRTYSQVRASFSWLLTILDNEREKKALINIRRAVKVVRIIFLLLIETL
jgi:hypothetical protein